MIVGVIFFCFFIRCCLAFSQQGQVMITDISQVADGCYLNEVRDQVAAQVAAALSAKVKITISKPKYIRRIKVSLAAYGAFVIFTGREGVFFAKNNRHLFPPKESRAFAPGANSCEPSPRNFVVEVGAD
jgi:hypothetical protein